MEASKEYFSKRAVKICFEKLISFHKKDETSTHIWTVVQYRYNLLKLSMPRNLYISLSVHQAYYYGFLN